MGKECHQRGCPLVCNMPLFLRTLLSQEGGECVVFVFRVLWQVYSQWRQTR